MKAGKVILITLLAGMLGVGFAILIQRWQGVDLGPKMTSHFTRDGEAERLDRLPPFVLPDVNGKEISSSRWTGKVVVLNFWATWCPPCLRELPLFDELQRTHSDDIVQVVGIAIDQKEDVQAFLDKHPVSYPILVGDADAIEMSRRLGNRLQGLPFTVIFDRSGKYAYDRTGEMTSASLSEHLDPLLPDGGGRPTTGN